LADLNARDATTMRVQAIGEHMRSLSNEYRESHPELPWRQAIAMRNIIAHEYGNVDYEIIWEVVTGADFASFRVTLIKSCEKKARSPERQLLSAS